MNLNLILAVFLLDRRVQKIKGNALFILTHAVIFTVFYSLLIQYLPNAAYLVIFYMPFIILSALLLIFFTTGCFWAYTHALFISLWIFSLMAVIENALVLLISPYLISGNTIFWSAVYFLLFLTTAFIWGIMMLANIFTGFYLNDKTIQKHEPP
mgnify:CR=1 FL=1